MDGVFTTSQPNDQNFAEDLAESYQICKELTKKASSTFFLGSLLMPKKLRRHVWAIYSFCRFSDDCVDNRIDDEHAYETLRLLREIINCVENQDFIARIAISNKISENIYKKELSAIFGTIYDTFKQYPKISSQPYLDLLKGVESDIRFKAVKSADELDIYCNKVAGGVGVMICELLGITDFEILSRARKMGNAMQVTNILRDIGEDYKKGRIYIPEEELKLFGIDLEKVIANYSENIIDSTHTSEFKRLMKELIKKNRADYNDSRQALYLLPRQVLIPLLTASLMYEAILQDIENHDYDVFTRRAHTTSIRKIELLSRAVVKSFLPMLH